MKHLLPLALVFLASLPAQAAESKPAKTTLSNSSIVRVNSTNQSFDFLRPWTKKTPYMRRGLGVVLPGNRVLVTAEIVANHTYIELEKPATTEKSPAEIKVVDYDANLAILTPLQPDFLKDAKVLELDSGAEVGDAVSLYQFEQNGQIALTPGVISTIAVTGYPLDRSSLLAYRVSAPLQNREGSFTIPALRNGRLTGLLMRYDSRSQTAEIIPAPVIAHFLKLAGEFKYQGFPRAGLAFSAMRDPQLRRYIGLKENGGVYITEVLAGSAAAKAGLKKGDVLLSVDGKKLDQDGNYEDAQFGKIPFSHITTTQHRVGDTIEFLALRDGEQQKIPVTLASSESAPLVSEPYLMDTAPEFFILGGLVFQELTRSYLQEWGSSWTREAPQRLVYLDAFQNELPEGKRKIVFLSQVLPSPDTLGYEGLDHLVVEKINGVEIKNLADIATAVKKPENGFHKIDFEGDPGTIYLDAAEIEANAPKLIEDYSLPTLQHLKADAPASDEPKQP